MKKLLIRLASLLAVTLMMPSMPFGIVQSVLSAQTITTRTTLKTAITTTATGTVTVTPNSMTGIVALSAGANPNGIASTFNFCLIDGELGQVVNGTVTATTFNWRRGAAPSQHLANAEIHCGPGGFVWTPNSGGGGVTTGVFSVIRTRRPRELAREPITEIFRCSRWPMARSLPTTARTTSPPRRGYGMNGNCSR